MVLAIQYRINAGLLLLVTLLTPGITLVAMEATVEKELQEFDAEVLDPGHTHLGPGLIDRALENNYDAWREEANRRYGLDWLVA
jgi:hypothetical protein